MKAKTSIKIKVRSKVVAPPTKIFKDKKRENTLDRKGWKLKRVNYPLDEPVSL